MKKILVIIILFGLLFFAYQNKTVAATVNQFLYQSPCDTPKSFRIGTVDPRFGISRAELLQDAEGAGSVWKNNKGTILMQYSPQASMTISMVYDQRQYLNSQITTMNNQVTQQKDNLKPEISSYEQRVTAFKKKSDDLNAEVQYWNNRGGAPEDVYNKLTAEQQALQLEANQLQQIADQLNQSTDQYNQQIQQLNQKVDNYNNVLQSKPEEGLYSRNGTNESIDIYFNNSQMELIHTLAHEMGHALGLEHNSNPQSIMYPFTNLIVSPSVTDEAALAVVCKKQSIFEIAGENIAYMLVSFKQNIDTMIARQ